MVFFATYIFPVVPSAGNKSKESYSITSSTKEGSCDAGITPDPLSSASPLIAPFNTLFKGVNPSAVVTLLKVNSERIVSTFLFSTSSNPKSVGVIITSPVYPFTVVTGGDCQVPSPLKNCVVPPLLLIVAISPISVISSTLCWWSEIASDKAVAISSALCRGTQTAVELFPDCVQK